MLPRSIIADLCDNLAPLSARQVKATSPRAAIEAEVKTSIRIGGLLVLQVRDGSNAPLFNIRVTEAKTAGWERVSVHPDLAGFRVMAEGILFKPAYSVQPDPRSLVMECTEIRIVSMPQSSTPPAEDPDKGPVAH
jgi:hypothetical protein